MSGIIVWLTLAAVLAGPPAQAAAPATQPAVQAEVGRLIKQLGDADFKLRTAALARLKAIGVPAYEQIKAAAEDSDDAEVAVSCEELLVDIGPRVATERRIRKNPRLTVPLGALAKTHPHVVALLGGSAEQQITAMHEMRAVNGTAAVLDILYHWATNAKDASVRAQAGYSYVLQGTQAFGMALVAKDARRRRRMTDFVFAGKGGWTKIKPPLQARGMNVLVGFKEAAPLFRAAAEKCIQANPAVAGPLKTIAKTHVHIVAGLGGAADSQVMAVLKLRGFELVGEPLDVLHYWATRAGDASVCRQIGEEYALCTKFTKVRVFLEKDAVCRRQFVEFAFTKYQSWSSRRSRLIVEAVSRFLRFEESTLLFVQYLLRLRKDPKADFGGLCKWFAEAGKQPASLRRQLVPALVIFLDDTRIINWKGRLGRERFALQIADHAIFTLRQMLGGKWAVGLPKVATHDGAFVFKSDAVRQKYITAFRTWYNEHRDQFAPDPAIQK